ncbi:MAG: phage protease [Candidatus Binataceae bacterium]
MTKKPAIQNDLSAPLAIEAEATIAAAFAAIEQGATPPEWIRLIPAGRFTTRDGRGPFVNDDPEAVVEATRALGMEAGLPVDYDHATDFGAPRGTPAPAAGWVTEFDIRSGEIWGRVEWTEAGAAKLAAKEYCYISPVFELDKSTKIVTRILRVALTNNPALFDTAIASRRSVMTEEKAMEPEEFRAALCRALGMADDSTHEQILARLAEFVPKGDRDGAEDDDDDEATAARLIATGKVVSSESYKSLVTEVNALKAEGIRERAERSVTAAMKGGKLLPAQREWALAYCARDEKGFEEFIAKQPAILRGEDGRLSARPPSEVAAGVSPALSDSERAICARLGLTTEQFIASKRGGVKQVEEKRPASES